MAPQARDSAALEDDPLWFKDAVIYQLHVKAFMDSDADGIGDFKGLTQKLDYLQRLGVTAIWLLPFYPSPMRDDGYDISEYCDTHPAYGRLRDFRSFLQAAHRRGLRVITELVINHTSDRHEWFRKARQAPAGSKRRNFYVWSDTPEKYQETRIIFQDFARYQFTAGQNIRLGDVNVPPGDERIRRAAARGALPTCPQCRPESDWRPS